MFLRMCPSASRGAFPFDHRGLYQCDLEAGRKAFTAFRHARKIIPWKFHATPISRPLSIKLFFRFELIFVRSGKVSHVGAVSTEEVRSFRVTNSHCVSNYLLTGPEMHSEVSSFRARFLSLCSSSSRASREASVTVEQNWPRLVYLIYLL